MKSNKRFSFVIPTYENKNLIKNTLETLNRQEGFPVNDYEVIVVDDGSTDGTRDVIKDMEKNYELKYIYLERDAESTRSRARNTGIKAAEGEIIIFIDGDMLLKYNYLSELDKCFKINDNIIVIGTRVNLTEEISYEEILNDNYYEYPKFKIDNFSKFEIRHLNYTELSYNAQCDTDPWLKVYSCNLVVPKKLLNENGYFDESFKGWGLEDVELGYRLYKSGARIVINNKIEAFHQKHEKGGMAISKDRFQEIDKNTYYFMKKHPDALKIPKLSIIKLFRGQVTLDLRVIKGFRKEVVINLHETDNLQSIKDEILKLSQQKSLKIVVIDHIENSDLNIWIQLIGKQNSTPLYFPASKQLVMKNVMGTIGFINIKAYFVRMGFKSFLVQSYAKLFRK